jgi:hypothetical protein
MMALPIIITGIVKDEVGKPQKQAILRFTGNKKIVVVANDDGTLDDDIGNIDVSYGTLVTYTVENVANTKIASGSFTAAEEVTLTITLTERTAISNQQRTGYSVMAVIESIGGKTISQLNPLPTEDLSASPCDVRYDTSDAQPTYIGVHYGSHNATTTADEWTIYKFTYSGTEITRIQKVEKKAWTNRAGLF